MFKNMTVKLKLRVLTILTALGFIVLIGYGQSAIFKMHEVGLVNGMVQHLDVLVLELGKSEKGFVSKKDMKYAKEFQKTIKEVIHLEREVEDIAKEQGIYLFDLELFFKEIKQYEKIFKKIINLQQQIGLTPTDGLYGSLRSSVQKVQDIAKNSGDNYLLAQVYDLRKQEKDFMLRKDLQYVDNFNTKIDDLISENLSQNINNTLKQYKNSFNSFVALEKQMGLSLKEGLLGEFESISSKTFDTMHHMEEEMEHELDNITDKITYINLIIALLIMSVIIVVIFILSKQISSSISKFQDGLIGFFDYINKKSDTVNDINSDIKDEFGIMADMVNKNIAETKKSITEDRNTIDATIKVLREFEQGDLSKRVKVNSTNQSLKELTKLLNQMAVKMEENINSVLSVLEEYAKYDYTNSVAQNDIKEHFLKLAQGVNTLGESTTDMLIENKSNGLTLDDSSDTLLKNVDILNTNSNKAAAALEETSSALEEMTSSISSNTENVIKMSGFANKLSTSASEGQTLANETTSSMDEINKQVSSINEAIKVIDQISFQTNILSLNAAVEAATAGEAGKGFAVVAQEVRNLAARSSEAANEIKSIVENATEKASNGKKIADKMIEGYTGLSNNINQTLELITHVEEASKEQQSGIVQINDAITSLDKQTQENASIASQTQTIATQTDEIAKMVVADANEKHFKGKDNVKAKLESSFNVEVTSPTNTQKRKENKEKSVDKTVVTPVVSDNSDDEWASF